MRIGIVGAGGRMGQMLVREVLGTEGVELVGAIDVPESPAHGHDAGLLARGRPCGVPIQDDPVPLFADADAVLELHRAGGDRALRRAGGAGQDGARESARPGWRAISSRRS